MKFGRQASLPLAFVFLVSLVLLVSLACAAAAPAAFEVALQKPEANASVAEGENEFEFSASGKSPLSCELFVDGVVALSNVTAHKNLPLVVRANVSANVSGGEGERAERALSVTWSVRCVDADGASAESEARTLVVQTTAGVEKPLNAGTLSDFVVARGAEREENALVASWRANLGGRVVFAALFSNDGANALNVSLKVTVTNASASEGASEASEAGAASGVVAALESERVLIAPGEKRVLQVEWTPASEGAFVVEGVAVAAGDAGNELAFQKAFIQLSVRKPPNVDWLFLVVLVCVAALALALFKTRLNAKAIKGGGLE